MKRSLMVFGLFCLSLFMAVNGSAQMDNKIELPSDEDVASAAPSAMANKEETALYRDEVSSPLDKRVTIRVSSVPIATFLNSISAQAKINFIMGEEFANKKVTASLTRVTVREALDTLLRVQGLTYQRIGKSDSYVVTKRSGDAPDVVTKIYTLNYISLNGGTGSASSNASASSSASSGGADGGLSGGTLSSMVSGASTGGGAASGGDVMEIIRSTMSPQGKIAVDPRTNKLIVTDVPEVFPQLENIIAELDIKPPQILIEAKIVELTKTSGLSLGLEYGGADGSIFKFTGPARTVDINYVNGVGVSGWSYIFPSSPVGAGGGDGTDSDAFLDFTSFTIVLKSLLQTGDAKFLGKPKVVTLNNQPARIEASKDAAIGTTQTDNGQTGTTSSSAERKTVGLILEVVPQVNREGYITLLVNPSYSDVTASNVKDTFDTIKRSAQTLVRVKNGQTVVLGGLLSSRELTQIRKVPFLGEIPVLGWLFTSKTSQKENTDMVIFITPTILAD